MKIVTAAEMREIDRVTTENYKVHSLDLMAAAGSAVATFAVRQWPEAKRITVICGKGNNGGDGLVAARKLHEAGREVRVILLARPDELQGDAAANLKRLPFAPRIITTSEQLSLTSDEDAATPDLLIDAILGTGFRPPAQGLAASVIDYLREDTVPLLSVDIPSGISSDNFAPTPLSCLRYGNAVVTFTAPKPSHLFDLDRTMVVVAHIGSPEEAIVSKLDLQVSTPNQLSWVLGPRDADSHKGDFGHVLVIGGSIGKAGAAAMAGMSALRAGAGLVTVACPASVLPTVAGFHPELMTEPLAESEPGCIAVREAQASFGKLTERPNVIAIGPGAGRHPDTAEYIRWVAQQAEVPVVLDADGLNAFEGHTEELSRGKRPLILTPHPGEMARLTGKSTSYINEHRIEVVRAFAQEHRCYVLLKGHRTLIAPPSGPVWVNPTGNPGMATGGSGDILTGVVAGLIAQARDHADFDVVLHAVCAGVYLHGLAGDLAAQELGEHSLVATDLVKFLPDAFLLTRKLAFDPFVWITGAHLRRADKP